MDIRIEQLVYTIQEYFDYISNYEKTANSNEWRTMSAEQRRYYERNEFHVNNAIWNTCKIVNVDIYRLFTIVRMVQRWEEAHQWKRCFPFNDEMNRSIYEYIKK